MLAPPFSGGFSLVKSGPEQIRFQQSTTIVTTKTNSWLNQFWSARQNDYSFKRGTTKVLKTLEKKVHYEIMSTNVREIKPNTETMEVA